MNNSENNIILSSIIIKKIYEITKLLNILLCQLEILFSNSISNSENNNKIVDFINLIKLQLNINDKQIVLIVKDMMELLKDKITDLKTYQHNELFLLQFSIVLEILKIINDVIDNIYK